MPSRYACVHPKGGCNNTARGRQRTLGKTAPSFQSTLKGLHSVACTGHNRAVSTVALLSVAGAHRAIIGTDGREPALWRAGVREPPEKACKNSAGTVFS